MNFYSILDCLKDVVTILSPFIAWRTAIVVADREEKNKMINTYLHFCDCYYEKYKILRERSFNHKAIKYFIKAIIECEYQIPVTVLKKWFNIVQYYEKNQDVLGCSSGAYRNQFTNSGREKFEEEEEYYNKVFYEFVNKVDEFLMEISKFREKNLKRIIR